MPGIMSRQIFAGRLMEALERDYRLTEDESYSIALALTEEGDMDYTQKMHPDVNPNLWSLVSRYKNKYFEMY